MISDTTFLSHALVTHPALSYMNISMFCISIMCNDASEITKQVLDSW